MDNKSQEVVFLKIEDIMPNRFQPREVFEETGLEELAESIKEHGVIQPIIVRPKGDKYELIAGERRCKASSMIGLTTIPAIVRDMDDKESAKVSLLENLQRKNLSPIEEARTYKRILELDNITQDSLAKTMGKSQPAIANKLRLLGLPEEVQDALIKNQISERHARSLLNVKNKEQQLMMLDRIKSERLTVRELDAEIKKMKESNNEITNNSDGGEEAMAHNMYNNTASNNFNQFNNRNTNNSVHGNFGGMGLNDYQNSGMYNNIPNFNNQNNMQNSPSFGEEFNNQFESSYDNEERQENNNIDYGDFQEERGFNMQPENRNSQMNNNTSLGSMFDRAPNVNMNNDSIYDDKSDETPFISQIREDAIKPKENQFLPNFDKPDNFNNNPNSFEDNNMNEFGNQEQDFGLNNFINQNNNNNNNNNLNNNDNFNNNNNNNLNNNDNFNNNNFNNNFNNNNNNFNNNKFKDNNDFNNNNNFDNNNFNNNNDNFDRNNMNNMGNFNRPIDDFSFPNQNNRNDMNNSKFTDFNANQGGLFNQPLDIVNVSNNNPVNNFDNRNELNNKSRIEDNYQGNNQTEKFDNPFDDPYEDILYAKPVSIENESSPKEFSEEKNTDDNQSEVEEVEVIGDEPTDGQEENLVEETPTTPSSEKKNDYIVLDPVKTIFDARGAVYELKKTTDAIKKNNISIDTEEIEFDDYYQITIKIKK